MNLRELYVKRRGQFWGEVLPYLGYVIQSGVAVVFLFLLIAFGAWYTALLRQIPPDLPIRWIMMIFLVPYDQQRHPYLSASGGYGVSHSAGIPDEEILQYSMVQRRHL